MNDILRYMPVFAEGLWGTVQIALVCLCASLPLGLLIGMGRYSRNWYWAVPSRIYVEVFRNTPVLVLIMWFFFAFPTIAPFDVDAYTAATLALTLNSSAFFAEVFRAGIQSLSRGQWDAAKALGMSYRWQMQRVILPQAIKRMIPAITNRWIELFKLTSLASVIAYQDLIHTAKLISSAYFNPVQTFTIAALIYFAMIYPMVRMLYFIEAKLKRSE